MSDTELLTSYCTTADLSLIQEFPDKTLFKVADYS